jgi:hypothetical protein
LFKTLPKLRGAVFTEKYGDEVCKVWFDENRYFAEARRYMEFEQAQAIANHTFNHKIAQPLRYPNSDRSCEKSWRWMVVESA